MRNFNAREIGNYYVEELLLQKNQPEWVWYHCYQYFSTARYQELTATDYNMLSLHLSVYLAQANMYHGSSFILQNGYKIHREAIQLICCPRYHVLSGISCKDLANPKNMARLFELVTAITEIYHGIRQTTYRYLAKEEPISPVSQALITKVLLGTLGCVPAYDGTSIKEFKQYQIAPQYFSEESLVSVLEFYQREIKDFNDLALILESKKIDLPQMKLVDIILQYSK